MGEHKYNPNCQLAKDGLLPPKKKPMGKRASERTIMQEIYRRMGLSALHKREVK